MFTRQIVRRRMQGSVQVILASLSAVVMACGRDASERVVSKPIRTSKDQVVWDVRFWAAEDAGSASRLVAAGVLHLPRGFRDTSEFGGSWELAGIPHRSGVDADLAYIASYLDGNGELKAFWQADRLFMDLHPDVIDNNVEITVLTDHDDIVSASWHYVTIAGETATGRVEINP